MNILILLVTISSLFFILGWTVLHEAAIQTNSKILELVLATGVSPNLLDKSGKSPLLARVANFDRFKSAKIPDNLSTGCKKC